ncbi:hypothetical protein GZL_02950 [Streptomyces sp. 769]|nr:hypothetical protein GZL_02950 [Streptomyces sp. 769]
MGGEGVGEGARAGCSGVVNGLSDGVRMGGRACREGRWRTVVEEVGRRVGVTASSDARP